RRPDAARGRARRTRAPHHRAGASSEQLQSPGDGRGARYQPDDALQEDEEVPVGRGRKQLTHKAPLPNRGHAIASRPSVALTLWSHFRAGIQNVTASWQSVTAAMAMKTWVRLAAITFWACDASSGESVVAL